MRTNRQRKAVTRRPARHPGQRQGHRGRRAWVVVLLVLANGAVWGKIGYDALLRRWDYVHLQEVVVSGAQRTSPDEISAVLGLIPGTSLLEVSPRRSVRLLEELPWVERASVARQFPDRVLLHLEEHEASLIVQLDKLYLADEKGVIFKELKPDDPADLPVVTGLSLAGEDRGALGDRLREALSLARLLGSCASGLEVGEIHFDSLLGYTVYTARDVVGIHLGVDAFQGKCERLTHVLLDLKARRLRPQFVDLDNGLDVVVRLGPRTS